MRKGLAVVVVFAIALPLAVDTGGIEARPPWFVVEEQLPFRPLVEPGHGGACAEQASGSRCRGTGTAISSCTPTAIAARGRS